MIEQIRPITIRIDPTIHNAMKIRAKAQRVQISLLYEQAAEAFLEPKNSPKKAENKANGNAAVRR